MNSHHKRTLKTKYQKLNHLNKSSNNKYSNHLNKSNNNKYLKIKNINNVTKKDVKFY